ncbi:MAG: hypothetical protein ACE5DZ_01455 [Mariprofundus sp.]
MVISRGKLTYDAEGMEGGRYHSRILHVPGSSSGLTLGRGYDMKEKSCEKVKTDLLAAGVDEQSACSVAEAAGLCGDEAVRFIYEHGLKHFEISTDEQERLFSASYDEMAADVRRICNKPDCVRIYGAVDWDKLNDKIRDVLVDLRFRGDYTPHARKKIQKLVSANDLQGFTEVISERAIWKNVPQDRFERRVQYLRQQDAPD